jgi:hypothetical protein
VVILRCCHCGDTTGVLMLVTLPFRWGGDIHSLMLAMLFVLV